MNSTIAVEIDDIQVTMMALDMTVIVDVEDQEPYDVPLAEFLNDNEFDETETSNICRGLVNTGSYDGGGGAAPFWTLTVWK